ncbi:hypothetical protein FRC01_010027 [Tulasnella sp. 417]|nr:hypothetical protein FRC01_010027 [Tulasnella sp. 417]
MLQSQRQPPLASPSPQGPSPGLQQRPHPKPPHLAWSPVMYTSTTDGHQRASRKRTSAQEDLAKLAQLSAVFGEEDRLAGHQGPAEAHVSQGQAVRATTISQTGEGPAGAVLSPSGRITGGLVCLSKTTKGPGTTGGQRLEKFQLVFKWGGELTYAARYQSRDLGENLRKDISILKKDMLHNVQIFTSSERCVTASAEIFTAALSSATIRLVMSATPTPEALFLSLFHTHHRHAQLDHRRQGHASSLSSGRTSWTTPMLPRKQLKILLRNGESERTPELMWPKNMKAEPAQVVQEVIQLMSSFRTTMRKNFETADVDKIQERWCCGDDPRNSTHRKYVRELYDALKFSALHRRTVLFVIVSENGGKEYVIEASEKEEIGVLTSLPLLRKMVADLEAVRNSGGSDLTVFFTKESHIHALVNLVLSYGLPIANPRIPELDYFSHITKLTQHLAYALGIEKLSKHFHRVPEDEDEEPLEAIDVPLANGDANDGSRG